MFLIAVGVLTAVGFASVYIARQNVVSTASLGYAGFFFLLYLAAHLVARYTVPFADPYLLPIAGLLFTASPGELLRLRPVLFPEVAELASPRQLGGGRRLLLHHEAVAPGDGRGGGVDALVIVRRADVEPGSQRREAGPGGHRCRAVPGLSDLLHRDWPGKWKFKLESEATLKGLAVLAEG